MYCYCLQCQASRCETIAELLQNHWPLRAISPKLTQRTRKEGKNITEIRDLLPGYLLLYAENPIREMEPFRQIEGVARSLIYGDATRELRGEDYDFAMNLYERDGIIGVMTLIRAGDTVRMKDPLFLGFDAHVLAVDYRKERAKVAYSFNNQQWSAWVACEVLFKSEEPKEESVQNRRTTLIP